MIGPSLGENLSNPATPEEMHRLLERENRAGCSGESTHTSSFERNPHGGSRFDTVVSTGFRRLSNEFERPSISDPKVRKH